jgi:elongation factor P
MISTNDLRNGVTIELDNGLWSVVEFLHVKPGKGSAFVRTKLKNVETGNVMEKTFRAGEKVPKAVLNKSEMEFLYSADNDYIFMDNESYEQITLDKSALGDGVKYLKENTVVNILRHGDRIIGVDLPNHIELEVTETPPAEKGNTAQGGTKPATLETGAVVNVPFFINVGDKIRVDTRTNEYLDRA